MVSTSLIKAGPRRYKQIAKKLKNLTLVKKPVFLYLIQSEVKVARILTGVYTSSG